MGPASPFTAHLELSCEALRGLPSPLAWITVHIYRLVPSRNYQGTFAQTLQTTCKSLSFHRFTKCTCISRIKKIQPSCCSARK